MPSLFSELRKIPMLPFALAAAAGVVLALYMTAPVAAALLLCLLFFLIAVVCLMRNPESRVGFAAVLVFVAAFTSYRATLHLDRESRLRVAEVASKNDSVAVVGRVRVPAQDSPRGNQIVVETVAITGAAPEITLGSSRLRVFGDSARFAAMRSGDWLYAAGRLSHGRDVYRSRGSLSNSVVRRELASVYCDSLSVHSTPVRTVTVRRLADGIRVYARRVFESRLSPDGAALCRALLLGDRGAFGMEFLQDLRVTGLSHIFALSGMNTGLILLVMWLVLVWLPLPHYGRLWILLATVLLYMEVGREAPSLVRASLVAATFVIGHLLHRRAVFLNVVLAAAFLELLWQPLDLVDPGFLLSYLAVLGIAGAYTWMRRALLGPLRRPSGFMRAIVNVAAGTGAAQLGTAPLVGFLFHRVPLTGLLGNLVVVPGFAFMLILAMMLLGLHPLFPAGARVVASAIDFVSWGLASVVSLSARMPAASLQVPPFGLTLLFILFTAVAAMLLALAYRRYTWLAFGLLLAANAFVWTDLWTSRKAQCSVTFIDVENGDATLISAGNTHVLIDAGPRYGDWTAANRILAEFADKQIGRLDALILSHPDNDHIGGAAELLFNYPVGRVLTNGDVATSRAWLDVELAAARKGCPITPLVAGERLLIAPGVCLTVMSPDSLTGHVGRAANRRSLVLRLDAGEASMLLPGDIDSTVEAQLGGWGTLLDVNVMKSPHHGAQGGTSEALLLAASPSTCLISAGRTNPYGHPSAEVLERLARHGVETLNTATEGTVSFQTWGHDWERVRNDTKALAAQWGLITL